MALVVVLWILALLGVIFVTFTFSMRTELAAAVNFREEAVAYHLAEAGIYQAAAELINAEQSTAPGMAGYDVVLARWRADPTAHQNVPLGPGNYWVTLADEEAKIALNGPMNPTSDAALRRLLSNSGVTDERLLSTIVDSIQDWRDSDSLHRLNGAEDEYYLALPTPYRAKNADFDSIDELLLVRGMTPEILYGNIASRERQMELESKLPWERQLKPGEYLGIARSLTVFGTGKVNMRAASPDVLMALGLTAAETKAILDQRAQGQMGDLGAISALLGAMSGAGRQGFQVVGAGQPGAATPQQVLAGASTSSKTFYVESTGQVTGSRITSRIGAVLRNDGTPGRPKFSIRLWSLDPRQGA